MKKFNKKGFTLIEMLVVIAVIAVLVSIVIPTVSNSTEKANEARDAANIRAYIAELSTNALSNGVAGSKDYTLTQTGDWETVTNIGGIATSTIPKTGTITISASTSGVITIAEKGAATACGAELTAGGTCTATTKDASGNCTNAAAHKA